MENEIMNYEYEVTEEEIYEAETEKSGTNPGLVLLIGAGIAAAGVAVVGLGKKLYANFKAKKELRLADEDDIEMTDDRVMEVTK